MSVDSLMSRANPFVGWLLRTPVLHWVLSPGLLLLTVTGRRSGRRYSIPVGYQRSGDTLTVLVSEAREKQWWRNFREVGEVEVRLRGRVRAGTARLVAPESEDFRAAAEQTLRRVPGMGRVFRVDFDRAHGLREDQLARLREEIAVVRIDLHERRQPTPPRRSNPTAPDDD